ncbi:hypothetical protein [Streptomyces sp. NPDC101455]|uniref:hypothetical protein n=1 Tax=Streptomyces sp. NPDC101455 TaxID=3366142 RepID=UPI0037F679BE
MDALERPARTEITALLTKLAAGPAATKELRRFFLDEYLKFLVERLEMPEERIQACDLLELGYASAWLAAAASGYTRQRPAAKPDAADASQAARCATFNAFARHLGQPERLSVEWPDTKSLPVEESQQLVKTLADHRPPRTNRSTWERTSALAALRVATGRPLSQLAALRREDLALDGHAPTVTIQDKSYTLDELTVRVVRRWLDTHTRLTAQLEGGEVAALWVTTKPGRPRSGEPARHPYLPCSIRALRAAQHDLTQRLLPRSTRLGQLTARDTATDAIHQAREKALADLKASRIPLGDLLDRDDPAISRMAVGRLLGSVPGVAHRRDEILEVLGVSRHSWVQRLTAQERQRLLEMAETERA